MKLQPFILLLTIVFGVTFTYSQTDDTAKNLYYNYKAKSKTERKLQRQQNTKVRDKNHKEQTPSPQNKPKPSKPQTIGVAPTNTGLPGTKLTIELLRNGRLSFVNPSFIFKSGDKIRLRLETNFEGYVTVLNLGTSGKINLLYPVEGLNNFVTPTSTFQIPQGEGWILFDKQPGAEIVSLIMSEDELVGITDLTHNSAYFNNKSDKDLLTQTSANDHYAVFQQNYLDEVFSFTLKLTHR